MKFLTTLSVLLVVAYQVNAVVDYVNQQPRQPKPMRKMFEISQVRQGFQDEVEDAINRQINMELNASYVYQSMAFYFDRDDVAMPGFAKLFQRHSEEEREHAEKLMKYQNMRGGRVVLKDIQRPDKDEWGTGLEALQTALQLEKNINQQLMEIHQVGQLQNDANFCDFIESEYLSEQVEKIKRWGSRIMQLKRAGPGVGEYLYDMNLQSYFARWQPTMGGWRQWSEMNNFQSEFENTYNYQQYNQRQPWTEQYHNRYSERHNEQYNFF